MNFHAYDKEDDPVEWGEKALDILDDRHGHPNHDLENKIIELEEYDEG